MRRGFAVFIVLGIVAAAAVGGYITFNKSGALSSPLGSAKQPSPSPNSWDSLQTSPEPKTTTPNNTSSWVNFYSKLYKYSLRRPSNFRKVLGNEDLFQATSPDYLEKEGVVTNGAIAQTITSDIPKSFEQAWGDYGTKLESQNIKVMSKKNLLVDGEKAYKIKLQNTDGTVEIRYLTYKSPYSYKTSILIGKDSRADVAKYEQILDDIINTFKF